MDPIRAFMLADSHGDPAAVDALRRAAARQRLDLVIHAGDVSDSGLGWQPFFEALRELKLPLYFVSGNHETEDLCERLAAEFGQTCLDYATARHADALLLSGLSGHNVFSASRERKMAKHLPDLMANPSGLYSILVSHEPPFPWPYRNQQVGSEMLGKIICFHKCDLVVTGHFHMPEPTLLSHPSGALVFNPGAQGSLVNIFLSERRFEVVHGKL